MSEHPLGEAIVAEARARGLAIPEVAEFQVTPGKGAVGVGVGVGVIVGNRAMLADWGVDPAPLAAEEDPLATRGAPVQWPSAASPPASSPWPTRSGRRAPRQWRRSLPGLGS
jgi:cation transport ATPase